MADHIKIRKAPGKWVVRAGGAVLGESQNALELTEGDYPMVIYFPRDDLAMAMLDKTETTSHCPYKGDATYYAIHTKSTVLKDAAWSYEDPKAGMEQIKDYVAFYASDTVAVEQL
ncbi:DUF427 domain-containing protein [Maritimibacter dapengensis]|uniref:DUF427 domain-containing protein n=1 Tax=Maritimibacter dapengensis TaxID=2836868 RepID=A0ABS6T1B2_9RHOB|nr:DUF427 domain-containing protein [Maritimibacter dapengensis]MBV7379027.1 DUF427 domain-containing protein [Maritimibacter dapengensis]